jgi:isoquinoline 1-oxidoreductase alpha subunit
MKIKLLLNGHSIEVEVDELDMPLLWLLRDQLKLMGTKYSCGEGLCGACSVLLNGRSVRSCVLPLSSCLEAEITTIEGLSSEGLNPVQRAWLEADIPQCGFCQPGQVVNLSGFITQNPEPSDADLLEALSSNYCRCKTYPDMLDAARQAVKYHREEKAMKK